MNQDTVNDSAADERQQMADNSLIARIPDRYVGVAVTSLPDPATTRESQSVEIYVPHIGEVKLHYEWHQPRPHQGTEPFWAMVRAEKLE